jgi:hypothetical protein
MKFWQRFAIPALAGAMLACAGSYVSAQVAMPPNMGPPPDAPPPKTVPLGPYAVTVATDPSLPTHTVYRPTNLDPFKGGKLPIVAWGNGGCINSGRAYEHFLTKIASHGFLVIAIGPDNVPPPDLSGLKPGDPLPPLPPSAISHASQLVDAIDWAIAQNSRAGSPYQGKLNPEAVAVMGQSCGGMQAIAVSRDPRVKTSVIWNSGVFNMPNGMAQATKDDLKSFHAPVAYFIGGPTDIAYANAEDDFTRIEAVPVFNANLHVGHGGTYQQPNGGWFGEVAVAWLSWRLKADKQAGKMFEGPKCGLCVDPAWTVKKKNMK